MSDPVTRAEELLMNIQAFAHVAVKVADTLYGRERQDGEGIGAISRLFDLVAERAGMALTALDDVPLFTLLPEQEGGEA